MVEHAGSQVCKSVKCLSCIRLSPLPFCTVCHISLFIRNESVDTQCGGEVAGEGGKLQVE